MSLISPKDHREAVAVFRAEIVGALARRELAQGELRAELLKLSETPFRPPGSTVTRTFGFSTIERWYYGYRHDGLAGVMPKKRSDAGHGQRLSPELRELILDIRREHASAPATVVRDTLIELGRMDEDAASVSLIQRLYREHGLPRLSRRARSDRRGGRLAWVAEAPMALWHGDVCHGPALTIGGVSKPLRIHALMDDASRYVVALEAHHTEQEDDMLSMFAQALRRYGAPGTLYLDNGSTYRGEVLSTACARLGVGLIHAQPYDPQSRGKQERFWRTLRERCLDYVGGLGSLHDVQTRLWAFLDSYHERPHAGLMGRTPAEAWRAHWRSGVARRHDEDKLRDALTERVRRRVRKDSTLSHQGLIWELEQTFLAGQTVTVACCRLDHPPAPWVEYQGKRFSLRPLDRAANGRRRRKRTRPSKPASDKTNFDPATARLRAALGATTLKGGDDR